MSAVSFNEGDKVKAVADSTEFGWTKGATFTVDNCWTAHGTTYVTIKEKPQLTFRASRFEKGA